MRVGVLALLGGVCAVSSVALADPADRVEASGFLGVDYFGSNTGLGDSLAPEQRPQTAPAVGARLTYILLRSHTDIRIDVGVEGEAMFVPAWTGYGFDSDRKSYFSPVFDYRGELILRIGDGWLQPHGVAGVGGATVASSSPYMSKETDPAFVWGLGATMPVSGRWQLRFDGRQVIMPARDLGMGDPGMTRTYEIHMSLGARFGSEYARTAPHPTEHVEVVSQTAPPVTSPPPPPVEPDRDSDNDGIPDKLDACPSEPELVNGIDDQDGCPEADPDHDGIVGAADKCPDKAEDFDQFQDEDGCPEDDNDKDGVPDDKDACPNEAETMNGIADDDGCADQLPAGITAALALGKKLIFDTGQVRLKTATKAALDKALLSLVGTRGLKIVITAHPDALGDAAHALAAKRADGIKWYMVEHGMPDANVSTKVGAIVAPDTPLIELSVGS